MRTDSLRGEAETRDDGAIRRGDYDGAVSKQKYWFHASPARNRASIERRGLLRELDEGGLTSGRTGVYLSRHALPDQWEDVWEVDVSGLTLIEDLNSGEDPAKGLAIFVEQDIGPQRIRLEAKGNEDAGG